MTRLKSSNINDITQNLKEYDLKLQEDLGLSLAGLACRAAEVSEADFRGKAACLRVSAVPMSCGKGVISSFSETLCEIVQYLGFEASVSKNSDIKGFAEAIEAGSDIVLSADDDRFVAFNLRNRRIVDNGPATGKGFAMGLVEMAGGVHDRPVLVIGCGIVGQSAAKKVVEQGGRVTVFDTNKSRCANFLDDNKNLGVSIADDFSSALQQHSLVIEATPAANIIGEKDIKDSTFIAAPGVPCGVTRKGREIMAGRLLWDPLQIGVATMLAEAVNEGVLAKY